MGGERTDFNVGQFELLISKIQSLGMLAFDLFSDHRTSYSDNVANVSSKDQLVSHVCDILYDFGIDVERAVCLLVHMFFTHKTSLPVSRLHTDG